MSVRAKALKAAFPYTIPICTGFLFLGVAYGIYMRARGFSFVYPMLMSMTIYAGSMEFVTVGLLVSAFNPLYAFLLTLMVNARHLYYGISMLDKFRGTGVKKFFLIFGMCDETFSINCTVTPPEDVDRGWFMLWVTVLNYAYWVAGATLGGLLGGAVHFSTKGIDFVMTALFVVIFIEQWQQNKIHLPAVLGLAVSAACLILFGADYFIIPAMLLIVLGLSALRGRLEGRGQSECQ